MVSLNVLLYPLVMIIGQRAARPTNIEDLLSPALRTRIDRLDVLSRKIFAGTLPGERRSKKRGQSVEFDDFRPYVPGDDLRHIDWNVFARLDRFFIKLFREEQDLSVVLVLDCSSSMDCGSPSKLVFAHQLALAIGYIALVNQNRLSAARFDQSGRLEQLRPIRGRPSLARLNRFVLDSLSAPTPLPGSFGFNEVARRVSRAQGGRGVMVVLSDFLDPRGWTQGLNDLAHAGGSGYDTTLIQILSPAERDPELDVARGLVGDVRLTDVETGRASEITLTRTLMDSYRKRLGALLSSLERDAKARAMRYLLAPSDTDLDALLLRSLRSRGVLG